MRFYSLVLLASAYQSISVLAVPVSSEVHSIGSESVQGQVASRRLHRRASKLKSCFTRACQEAYKGLDNVLGKSNQIISKHAEKFPNNHRAAVTVGKGLGSFGNQILGSAIATVGLNKYNEWQNEQSKHAVQSDDKTDKTPQSNAVPAKPVSSVPKPKAIEVDDSKTESIKTVPTTPQPDTKSGSADQPRPAPETKAIRSNNKVIDSGNPSPSKQTFHPSKQETIVSIVASKRKLASNPAV